MSIKTSNPITFLNTIYKDLDLQNGGLIKIGKDSSFFDTDDFLNKGQWLKLSQYLNEKNKGFNIDSIFFVENNPVIVFAEVPNTSNQELHRVYNQIWCMARPRLLFLATPTELKVFDLANNPFRKEEDLKKSALDTVVQIVNISTILNKYHRAKIETGKLFGDKRFEVRAGLADKALIENLKEVRSQLLNKGLNIIDGKIKYAHALIGRSIFIRYLEDRGILTKDYFYDIANKNPKWKKILDTPPDRPHFNPDMDKLLYPKVLEDKNFTYTLFEKLSTDFNGDIFPTDELEKKVVHKNHLVLIQEFLRGNVGEQKNLFFWAYKFDIIPIELISSIYEEFYYFDKQVEIAKKNNKKVKDDKGTHYTPASLVEFTLSRVLTTKVLSQQPTIIDPACGSGIFLVEAFRRVVRYETALRKKENLTFSELLDILQTQIAGIELNPEAVKIAAFSLYLAFLHYQDPPDIRYQIKEKKNKLPHLIYTDGKKRGKKYFDILVHSNAFDIENIVKDDKVRKRFSSGNFDVVIGNPPWGSTSKGDSNGKIAIDWCDNNNKPISDYEYSQMFIWRAYSLLKKDGISGLLVSSGILFKHSNASEKFKKDLLNLTKIQEIINFTHVREAFFSSAISPFLNIVFEKTLPRKNYQISYWSIKRTKVLENTQSVLIDDNDFKFFNYSLTVTTDIWKIFWFGNHKDFSLISGLRLYQPLKTYINPNGTAQGFKEANKSLDAEWLNNYDEFPTVSFTKKYGKLNWDKLKPTPKKVEHRGINKDLYEGRRLLIKRGITQKCKPKGQIISRFETTDFAFRNSIHCIKLKSNDIDKYKLLLGIIWSSLARYYFFMTASTWGTWRYEIHLEEILKMPVNFPKSSELKKKILDIVDKLRITEFIKKSSKISQISLFPIASDKKDGFETQEELEEELDNAIFELYELTEGEIDLIKDRCKYDIHHFYHHSESIAVKPLAEINLNYGLFKSLPAYRENQIGIQGYLRTFLKNWNSQVEKNKELNWQVINPFNSPMIAVIFNLQNKGGLNITHISQGEDEKWENLLQTLDENTRIPYSKNVYVEGIIRDVRLSENRIIIIKRNEQRLWTRSAAREDIEATILQATTQQS